MTRGITRRTVLSGAAAVGIISATGGFRAAIARDGVPDLAAARGPDAATNAAAAIEALGGMGAFVSPGQSVGISLNAMGAVACAHTDLEVLRTVVEMCKQVGAAEVKVLSWIERDRMEFSRLWERVPKTGAVWHDVSQEDPDLWKRVDCPRGKVLKGIRIFKVIEEPDVYISMPKFKHHSSARFSGALKLAMATTIRVDNRKYLHAERSKYLEQCIADLNLIARRADLILSDAMEVLTLRGPRGPGPTVKPQCVVAGTDPVALDAYCSPFMEIPAAQSVQITAAHDHGIGEMDLGKLKVQEIEVA